MFVLMFGGWSGIASGGSVLRRDRLASRCVAQSASKSFHGENCVFVGISRWNVKDELVNELLTEATSWSQSGTQCAFGKLVQLVQLVQLVRSL